MNILSVSTSKGIHYFLPDEILRLEACSNYTNIYLTNNRRYLTSKVLKTFTPYLESKGFIRAHRTHLINPLHIAFINRDGLIYMKDDTTIKISRRKKSTVCRNMDLVSN